MGVIGDAAHHPGDVMRRLQELERAFREMAASRRLENASIGAGGVRLHSGGSLTVDPGGTVKVGNITITKDSLIVTDSSGATVLQLGLLSNGQYGLAAIDPVVGGLVEMAALAFRQSTVQIAAREGRTSTSFGDLTTVGPTVSGIEVGSTGKMVVELGTRMFFGTFSAGVVVGGLMSFQVSGPTSLSPSVNRSVEASLIESAGQFGVGRQFLVTGLSPGTYSVTAKYASSTAGENCDFFERVVTVSAF
ncbi:MAG: hypothetical protein ACRDSK_13675 [Actinophytocola sp.]|uniref:hypothetical protein n=1 Tax=Actinophytocola sp. TaxID=1872138 RepID=UPI003D6B7B78